MSTSTRTFPVYDARSVGRLLNVRFMKRDIARYGSPPRARKGFVTFFDPGWSIFHLRDAMVGMGIFRQKWYDNEAFAAVAVEERPQYRQVRTEAVKHSVGKTFAEQRALLSSNEEVPQARVVIMGMIVHFLATDERLYPKHWVRCADKDSDDLRVCVGFERDGVYVGRVWDGGQASHIGLASSRKF